MKSEEIWKDVDRFPNYEVSSEGRVRNKKTKETRSISVTGYGNSVVTLYSTQLKRTITMSVYGMMQKAFGKVLPAAQELVNQF